jgi:meiotically up-regulated gene 157 (Mug157) protein
VSDAVDNVVAKYSNALVDPDIRMLFANCFPNTIDTTIVWHDNSTTPPQTYLITGDIDGEWLRDSYRQLSPYIRFVNQDEGLKNLIRGAIATQSQWVSRYPYCNGFHPPSSSGIKLKSLSNTGDKVSPKINTSVVFECKYAIDSLAAFLALSNEYYAASGDSSILDTTWTAALDAVLKVIQDQMQSTYLDDGMGGAAPIPYSFERTTTIGTETLNLFGMGNPANANVSLIKSAFRPSDDATTFPYFIPGNAMMSVELVKTGQMFKDVGNADQASQLQSIGEGLVRAVWENGVKLHPKFGYVFAYEVDGYGSTNFMDDANIPSLLSLPDLGFLNMSNPIYQNTRKMILSKEGNPYYVTGSAYYGIGGPHRGINNAWPMSTMVAIRTSTNETEIAELLELLKGSTSGLGLMHESVAVDNNSTYTRNWFGWANSEFAKTIFDVAERYPHLLFGSGSAPVL